MADNKNKLQMTPEEVQQTVMNQGSNMQAGNMNGYQPVTPVNMGTDPTATSAWRNIQRTDNGGAYDFKSMMGAQPGAYNGMYQQQVGQTMNNLLGQKNFNYDVNTDALYQQIKDNYIRNGRQAMMDTQGAAAALTGGYGNSYGAQAGQQAYQNSLGNLSAQIPELYNLAYQRYLGNENSQRQNLAALQGLDESQYQRYQYDTQQYEQQLQNAYEQYKKGQGGGYGGGSGSDTLSYSKYKQYVSDGVAWVEAGGDINTFVNGGTGLGAIPKNAAGSIINSVNSVMTGKGNAALDEGAASWKNYQPKKSDRQ